jgi:hypothetical protein
MCVISSMARITHTQRLEAENEEFITQVLLNTQTAAVVEKGLLAANPTSADDPVC